MMCVTDISAGEGKNQGRIWRSAELRYVNEGSILAAEIKKAGS
jgi:hypothetical protein